MDSRTVLETDIRFVKGIGEKRAKLFEKLGIFCLGDLLRWFPRDYEDRRSFRKIRDLSPGESACVSAIVGTQGRVTHVRRGMDLFKCKIFDETGTLDVTFFNQKFAVQQLTVGESFIFFGRVQQSGRHLELVNPVFEREGVGKNVGRIVPVYPLCAGLSQAMVRASVAQALERGLPDEVLPDELRRAHKLCHTDFAYREIHFPENLDDLTVARRRLIFEELFFLCLGLSRLKERRKGQVGEKMEPRDLGEFTKALPFALTGAQARSAREIMADLTSGACMNRLLQGDVGSGKTVVAAAAAWFVWKNGRQSALMAPTEILAEQHYDTLGRMLSGLGMHVDLLTGAMKASEKREVLERLRTGETDLVVGTHALLSQQVEFSRLGLVVSDEQHRFGVRQRAALSAKGEQVHVLVMSATPIPRTLALILYGDLDVSVLDELPPGRQKVDTFALGESMRPRVERFVRKLVAQGRQVYIVCPLVEEDDTGEGRKAVEAFARHLQKEVYADLRVGILHGKLKPQQKDQVMKSFAAGELDILVATTVIEVGVDVPNAALMVVENAERFGLSQLHQLRGRVGRGEFKSYCILFSENDNERTQARLKVMTRTNNGFEIAEEDLKLRGPGDFFGNRQHGMPEMKIASLTYDVSLLKEAQQAAEELLAADPELERHPQVRDQMKKLFSQSGDIFN